jgi:hypothetical protein
MTRPPAPTSPGILDLTGASRPRGGTGIELGEVLCLLLLLMLLLLLSKLLPGSKIMIKSKMGLAPLLNSMAVPRRGGPDGMHPEVTAWEQVSCAPAVSVLRCGYENVDHPVARGSC